MTTTRSSARLGLAAAAVMAFAFVGVRAPAQDVPAAPSKPLSKTEMKKFADALGWWLLFGDEPATREGDKRSKKLADLQKFEDRNWKGTRAKWNGWISGRIPFKRKGQTELAWQYTKEQYPKNHIVWADAKGYRPGRPTPLVCALHGGGRGVGNGGQAMGGYGQPFAGKGCFVFAPTVPGPEYVFAHPMSEKFCRHFIHEISREVSIDFDRIYVVGHSLGGVGAWAFGARMPDFWAATVSGAGNPPGIVNDDYAYLYNTPLFIHHGSTDIQVPPSWNQEAEKHIKALDPPLRNCQFHWYVATDGRGHGYPADIPQKYEPWVMEQVRDMYPERVVAMCPIARSKDDHGYVDYPGDEKSIDTFWLGIRNRTAGVAKAVATLVGPNHIEATTSGVGQLVIYVSDEYLDLDKPVKVIVNGAQKHNAVVARSAEFLAKHIERTDDRGRFFSGEIVVPGDGGGGATSSGGGWDDDD
jgi:pimeloyl-ACP methyl ester carboxylesterase